MNEKTVYINVATDFSPTPGARSIELGEFSGEQFRRDYLMKYFTDPSYKDTKVIIDLDGVEGYGTSFLEEVFGGLVRDFGRDAVKRKIKIKAEILSFYKNKANQYVNEATQSTLA